MDNPDSRNSGSHITQAKSVKLRFVGASGNKNFLAFESRKALILQGFPGFRFFTGYKLATSKGFFCSHSAFGHGFLKLSGYFCLGVGVMKSPSFFDGSIVAAPNPKKECAKKAREGIAELPRNRG